MKRMIIISIITLCLLGNINVFADNSHASETKAILTDLNILDENGFSDFNTITREECLIHIMRVIGVTDENIEDLKGADLICFVDTAPFSYFGCANLSGIAFGEECEVDFPTIRTSRMQTNTDFFFFPKREATVKECLAFMIRCLQPIQKDYDSTIEAAKEIGLINDKDYFLQNPDLPITPDTFIVLLERLLQQKRYKYYDAENSAFQMIAKIDEMRSVSYLDMLTQRQK